MGVDLFRVAAGDVPSLLDDEHAAVGADAGDARAGSGGAAEREAQHGERGDAKQLGCARSGASERIFDRPKTHFKTSVLSH